MKTAIDNIIMHRGLAPDAKLAFTDLGGGGSDGIFTPQDLSDSYYRYPYDVGARVHSDSWGSSTVEYDFMASEVDSFTWDHQVSPQHCTAARQFLTISW